MKPFKPGERVFSCVNGPDSPATPGRILERADGALWAVVPNAGVTDRWPIDPRTGKALPQPVCPLGWPTAEPTGALDVVGFRVHRTAAAAEREQQVREVALRLRMELGVLLQTTGLPDDTTEADVRAAAVLLGVTL